MKHLSYLLRCPERQLIEITNNIDRCYYDKQQPKKKYGEYQRDEQGNIKYRNLCISTHPLKEIQRRVNSLLQQIEMPSYAYGSIKGKNNILNARQHLGNKYFFALDLKDFFSNITHHQVFRMFSQNKFSPTVSRILTQLTTYKGVLPQGHPSSPIISNLVFIETGRLLSEIIKEHHITFTSYLDDLIFSSPNDFKHITQTLLETIKSGGFYLNHKKISYKVASPEVTGIIIYAHKLWPMSKMRERAKTNPFVAAYIRSILTCH